MARLTLNVNGKPYSVDADPEMPLLYALRNEIGLNSPHFGCGLAQCGACTVLMDGRPVRSCTLAVSYVRGNVVTLAGLGTPEKPHPVQAAFIAEQVPQCGYCTAGWVMTAAALLERNPSPSDEQIRTAFAGIKCRCGTHAAILRAVRRAAETMARAQP